ncbi:SGT2 [Symbiodinium natans]|uniref:SGT2 protein n=1 Tax=Symbiodinium natans TaxID=878477 RepID=A0A812V6P3_9DINO|nr:SGT2 [Symbiodinium natans]
MSHIFGCKQTPPTPPTTSDEESSGSTSDAEMKKKKGNRAMGKKKYPKAVKYYTKAIKIDPENATYHLNRAIANAALELWKDAEADAANAVELQEDQPSSKGHFQLARARFRRGRCREAREALKMGLARFPTEPALLKLGREIDAAVQALEQRRVQEEEAEQQRLQRSAGPSGAKALTDQARALVTAGNVESALPLLAEARSAARAAGAKREEINAASLQGKVELRLRRWADAVSTWEVVVGMETEEFSMDVAEEREALSNAQNNLGIALKNAQRLDKAGTAFNEAYRLSTNGDDKVATYQAAQILQNASQCLLAQGKAQEARSLSARALEIAQRILGENHASLALANLALARCLRAEGQLRPAVTAYAKTLEIFAQKTSEECLAEIPEVPSRERLDQLQGQVKAELAQLLAIAEQAKANMGSASATSDGAAATGSGGYVEHSPAA